MKLWRTLYVCKHERYDHVRHSKNFHIRAINYCLKIAKLELNESNL